MSGVGSRAPYGRSVRRIGVSLVAMVMASHGAMVSGQTTTPTATPTSAEAAPNSGLADIVVTATYSAQNLQDTPIAITAISGEGLAARGLDNIQEIGAAIPNAFIRPGSASQAGAVTIAMRGVVQTEYNYAFDPGVGVYIDDVYHGTQVGAAFDLMDIERVEVLRGPQGTLFGKNSLGGAIRVFSKAPKGDESGNIEVTYGRYNRTEVRGSYDLKLAENLFARVSGLAQKIDGYVDQLDFTCQMAANGTPQLAGTFPARVQGADNCKIGSEGGKKLFAAKVMLRYVPTDALEFNLWADYSDNDLEMPGDVLIRTNASTTDGYVSRRNDEFFAKYGIRYDDRFVPQSRYQTYATFADPDGGRQYPNYAGVESWSVAGKVDYDITPDAHAKFIAAYKTYDASYTHDPDASPLGLSIAYFPLHHEQTSLELQLTGNAFGDLVDWTAGGYYYEAKGTLRGAIDPYVYGRWTIKDDVEDSNRSAFAHIVVHPTERLSLTGGLRWSRTRKSYTFNHPGLLVVPDPVVGRITRVDWKLGADFKLTDDLMVYGQAATGFRPPGVNPRPTTAIQLQPFDAEEMTSYEVGLKSEFFDRRLRLNLAGFYSDYSKRLTSVLRYECTGLTTPVDLPSQCGTRPFVQWFIFETAPATVKGVEAELTARPIDGLTINSAVGYNHFKNGIKTPGQPGYRSPEQLIQPEWNVTAGAEYAIPLAGGTLIPRLDWFYQSHMTFGPTTTSPRTDLFTVPAYSTFNGRLGFQSEDQKWKIELSATNLFNKFYYYNLFSGSGFALSGQPSRPREWAVTLKRRF
jgi:iron complex outermembrane receptor protein